MGKEEKLVELNWMVTNYVEKEKLFNKEVILFEIQNELNNLNLFLKKFELTLNRVIFYFNQIIIFISKSNNNLDNEDKMKFEFNFENKTYKNNIEELNCDNKSLYIKLMPYFLYCFKKSKIDRFLVDINIFKNQGKRRRRRKRNENS